MKGIKFEHLGNSQDIHSFLTQFGYSAGNQNYRVEREEAVDKSVEKENKRVSEAAKNERVQIKEGLKREMEAGDNLQNESLDQDYESSENVKKSRRSDTVQIEFPKAPFDNPFMAATLDRLKITSNQAGVISN